MPAASTAKLSVQVLDFEDMRLLIRLDCLICDFCSSGQRFACGFLQIPPRDGHPCRPANRSPCRVCRRLSLPSECALPGAHTKSGMVCTMPLDKYYNSGNFKKAYFFNIASFPAASGLARFCPSLVKSTKPI